MRIKSLPHPHSADLAIIGILLFALGIPLDASSAPSTNADPGLDPPANDPPTRELYAEFLRGDFETPDLSFYGPTTANGITGGHAYLLLLGYRGQLNEKLGVHVAFPFADGELLNAPYSGTNPPLDESQATMGNPYVGLVFQHPSASIEVEFGVNLPMVPESDSSKLESALAGGLIDYVKHAEYYAFYAVPVSLRLRNPKVLLGSFRFRWDVAAHLWFAEEGRNDAEFMFDYGAGMAYEGKLLQPAVELRGRINLSGDNNGIGDGSYEARASLGARLGLFRPALEIRTPLDDPLDQIVDLVYGLRLGLDLP